MVSYSRLNNEVVFESPLDKANRDGTTSNEDDNTPNNPLLSSFDGPDLDNQAHKYSFDEEFAEDDTDTRLNDRNTPDSPQQAGGSGSRSQTNQMTAIQNEMERLDYNSEYVAAGETVAGSPNSNILNNTAFAFLARTPLQRGYNFLRQSILPNRSHRSSTPFGQGTDGVFSNLMAKPTNEPERDETHPPTFEEAMSDPTPAYWESAVVSPGFGDEVFVDGLPVGNIVNLVWNLLVTIAFQFVGFLLTYLLHTSHAAKEGSRAGLGITLVTYGYNMIPFNYGSVNKPTDKFEPLDPNDYDVDSNNGINSPVTDHYSSNLSGSKISTESDENITDTPYFAYGLIALGCFILLKALVDYYKVKRMERAILNPPINNIQTNSRTEPIEV